MNQTPFQTYLESRHACAGARAWVADQTLAQAWATCKRTDWLLWLVEAEASRVYQAARAEAWRVYLAATAEPRRVYQAAIAEPQRVYEAAIAEPRRVAYSGASPDEFRARVACPTIEGV